MYVYHGEYTPDELAFLQARRAEIDTILEHYFYHVIEDVPGNEDGLLGRLSAEVTMYFFQLGVKYAEQSEAVS